MRVSTAEGTRGEGIRVEVEAIPGDGGGYPGGGYPGGGGGYPQGGGQNPRQGGDDHQPYVDGKKTLERICGETGGRVFEVGKKQSIDDIYKQIGEELRAQYRVGFIADGRCGQGPLPPDQPGSDRR